MTKISKPDLFIELSNPDENGISRWIDKSEFVGKYEALKFENGFSWGRRNSSLAKRYIIETDKTITKGPKIDRIRLAGYNNEETFNQRINPKIVEELRNKRCVFTGVCGNSENTKIEIDHKDGRKNDMRVSNMETQLESDFQPCSKCMNDIKRQICKVCNCSGKRFDARTIPGYIIPWFKGNESLEESGCEGCFYHDPIAFRLAQLDMARKGEI